MFPAWVLLMFSKDGQWNPCGLLCKICPITSTFNQNDKAAFTRVQCELYNHFLCK